MPALAVAVWAGQVVPRIPSAPRECRDALRPEQPAQVVRGASPAAGLLPAGTDWGVGFALFQGQVSPELRVGALQYSQAAVWVPRQQRGRAAVTAGQSCAAGPHGGAIPARPAALIATSQRKYLGRRRVPDFQSSTGDKQMLFLMTQLLCLCPIFGQAPGCERSAQSECWWGPVL